MSVGFPQIPRWKLRSGNLGLSSPVERTCDKEKMKFWGVEPVDGDGGADGKVGNDHHTGVE